MTYVERLARFIYWLPVIYLVVSIFDATIGLGGYDATDSGRVRSGLTLYRDAETGCEYVSRWIGVTPRVAPGGGQMGCRAVLPPSVP